MQVDIKEAENMKKTHGTAIVDVNLSQDSTLDIHMLSDVINARYEQIFFKINDHLKKLERD
ncbi:MAG: cell division protein FtsA [bacterium]|jgi:cell division ATPase FtsA